MSVIVLGLSHRSAPIDVLEAATLDENAATALARDILSGENVTEAVVVATCNRVEVYAEALTFHGALSDIGAALAAATRVSRDKLTDHLYVHYEERAIAHAFSVACGLDSMAIGESQILGQLRAALAQAQRGGHAGATLNALFQHALRVGKLAHTETDLDRVGRSLIQLGLGALEPQLGPLAAVNALVVGAGSMSSLAATTLIRQGVAALTVLNRTPQRAQRLASGLGARGGGLDELPAALIDADLIICCTGALGHVVTAEVVSQAMGGRSGRPQAYLDLALPRDVEPGVAEVAGVRLAGLAHLAGLIDQADHESVIGQVRDLVTAEVAAFVVARRTETVAPTVAALRSQAARVVAAELDRLEARLPGLDEASRAQVRLAVHRVVEKLLHTPTVRVKELAGAGQGGDYAHALRELFDLDPYDVAAVSSPPEQGLP